MKNLMIVSLILFLVVVSNAFSQEYTKPACDTLNGGTPQGLAQVIQYGCHFNVQDARDKMGWRGVALAESTLVSNFEVTYWPNRQFYSKADWTRVVADFTTAFGVMELLDNKACDDKDGKLFGGVDDQERLAVCAQRGSLHTSMGRLGLWTPPKPAEHVFTQDELKRDFCDTAQKVKEALQSADAHTELDGRQKAYWLSVAEQGNHDLTVIQQKMHGAKVDCAVK